MKKRIISILLILCIVLPLMPVFTLAVGSNMLIAKPSRTTFVMNSKVVSIPEAYSINGNNYLQLRSIAVLLNGTEAQFNVGWDGTYAFIETGKPYTGSANPATLSETTNVQKSTTKFKLDGKIISFNNAYLIGGNANYLQLREVAMKLDGTASQFNIYWDSLKSQAVIVPGAAYTGLAPGEVNFYDDDVTWLGTTSEYQKTLKVIFDSGLRKVKVGDKYGLVDIYGNWAAEPIYDNIDAHYWRWNSQMDRSFYPKGEYDYERTETIFVDGYVQAIRNGKMGLLDTTGKEVIPCKYDAVGLPTEGVCRITKNINGKTYLGYWNLELGKEIVAPDKYAIPVGYEYLGSAQGDYLDKFDMEDRDEGHNPAFFDFIKGYAMVPTGKMVTVTQANQFNRNIDADLCYVQIIDKNGKEVLPKPYPFNITPAISRSYPQAGPYLVYDELSTKRLRMRADSNYDVIFDSHLESGIVGQKGILVPAQYHGGIWGNSVMGWYPPGAQMKLIPELSLALTYNCSYDGFRESAARLGVINFNNKVIIPFDNVFLDYDSKNKVFNTSMGDFIYRPDGTKIAGTESRALYYIGDNGYVFLGDADDDGKITSIKGVISVRTGKTYTHENLKGNGATDVSAKDTLWVKKGNKWGLAKVDGSIIIPFEYDEVYDSAWLNEATPYAIVKKGGKVGMVDISGKVLLPCNYRSIEWADEGYMNIQDDATGKYGIYNFNIKKITTPCIMSGSINTTNGFGSGVSGSIGGTSVIVADNGYKALFDMDTGKQVTTTYASFSTMGLGLFYSSTKDLFGPDGRVVFSKAIEDTKTYTLVVKGGKVGTIDASRLKIGGKLPTATYEKPVAESTKAKVVKITYPYKSVYFPGERLDMKGLEIHYQDENGVVSVIDNSKLVFKTSYEDKEIKQGDVLPKTKNNWVEILYNGKELGSHGIKVLDIDNSSFLENGNYYIKILGKYIYPEAQIDRNYSLVLSDKKPDKPFKINMVDYDEERGPMYTITYDGFAVIQTTSKDGSQLRVLISDYPYYWRINKYSSFCTIRDYGKQKLLVNASGAKSDNGTKVTVWTYTGSAPEHGKVQFIKAD